MKKLTIILMLFTIASAFANINKNFNFSKSTNDIQIDFKTPYIKKENVTINGKDYTRLSSKDATLSVDTGEPELPIFNTFIEIDNQGGYDLTFKIEDNEIISDINLSPSQEILKDSKDPIRFYKDNSIYNSDKYQKNIVKISDPIIIRNKRVLQLSISPVIFYPQKKEINIANSISITLKKNNSSINELKRNTPSSKSFDNVFENIILNNEDTRIHSYTPKSLLIIYATNSNEGYNEKLQEFIQWKKEKGFHITTVTKAEAGNTNSAIKEYIQNLYNTSENPPEYIILLGDTVGDFAIPTFIEDLSHYGGAGDLPYVLLAGNDNIPDAFVGRVSFETITQFKTIINKFLKYEKLEDSYDNSWLKKALMAAASSHSGTSTYFTNRYIKELMESYKPNYYTFNVIEQSNTSPAEINNYLNEGKMLYSFRGWIGMDQWGSYINQLSNDGMPFAGYLITCSTGKFADSYGEAITESVVRIGTVATSKGAIGAIGLSTPGTHTAFNNCLLGGMFYGLFTENLNTMAESLVRGQIHLHQNYANTNPEVVYKFSHWSNLIGDPSLPLWKQIPEELNITSDTSISQGTNFLYVNVTSESNPIENALVTAYDEETDYQFSALTDINGNVSLILDSTINNNFKITASKPQYIPVQETITVQNNGNILFQSVQINGDNIANPGEEISFNTIINNATNTNFTSATSTISTNDPYINIITANAEITNCNTNTMTQNATPYVVQILGSTPNQYTALIKLEITQDGNTWNCGIPINISAPNIYVSSTTIIDDNDNILNAGETAQISFTFINSGNQSLENAQMTVRSLDGKMILTDSTAVIGNIPLNSPLIPLENVTVEISPLVICGQTIPVTIFITSDSGFNNQCTAFIPIGEPTITDPTGPDAYGYLCYDNNDNSPDAPSYDWIEISDSGTQIQLSDHGENQDCVEEINLPFDFMFYGQQYDKVYVCSNGWISFEKTTQGTFRNWLMPGPLGPQAMVAAFWDDLIISGNSSGVYYKFDPSINAFIIQWNNLKNFFDNASTETFQIILYNSMAIPTCTGDGLIKIQYKEINNIDLGSNNTHGNYATVGIKDQTSEIGIQYTCMNEYPVSAKPLENEMAISFRPAPQIENTDNLMIGQINLNGSLSNTSAYPGEIINLGINLMNYGSLTAEEVTATLTSNGIYASVSNPSSNYPNIESISSAYNSNPFIINVSNLADSDTNLPFTLVISSSTNTWTRNFTIPIGKNELILKSFGNYAFGGNNDDIIDIGESGKIIVSVTNPLNISKPVTATLTSNSSEVIVQESNYSNFEITKNSTYQFVFNIDVSENAQSNSYNLLFSLNSEFFDNITENIAFTPGQSSIFNDFEQDNGNYEILDGVWQHGNVANANSGTKVWATSLDSNYPNDSNASLITAPFTVGNNTILTYWQKYNFESTYDGGHLRVSVNNGDFNTVVTPTPNYNYSNINSSNTPGFSGVQNEWQQITVDLSEFSGSEIKFCWKFTSDGSMNSYSGWYIDDVSVNGNNLSFKKIQGNVTVEGNNDIEVEIKDIVTNEATKCSQGNFNLFVNSGPHQLELSAYSSTSLLTETVEINNYDFTFTASSLKYLYPVSNFAISNNDNNGNINLSWENDITSPNINLQSYSIYKKTGAGTFILLDTTTENSYTDICNSGLYSYYVIANYIEGSSAPSEPIEITVNVDNNESHPLITNLYHNYPNPFNPETTISFSTKDKENVKINIYNIKGQKVKTLTNKIYSQGPHYIKWSGRNDNNQPVSSGIYFIKMETKGKSITKKAILLK